MERILLRGKFRLKIPSLILLYGIFVFTCYLNIWLGHSINSALSYQLCTTLWRNFVFVCAAYYYVTTVEIDRIKDVFIIGVVLGSLFAFVMSVIQTGSIILRGDGSSFNANTLAISAAIAMCFIICSDKFKLTPKNSVFLLILGLLCIFSGTRKALIAVALIVVIYIVLKNPRKLFKNVLIVLLLLVAIYIAIMKIPFIYNMIGNRIETMVSLLMGDDGDSSAESRAYLIEIGLKHFKRSPFFGNGINCFHSIDEAFGVYSHSNYVELLFSVGIVGTVAYYSMFFAVMSKAIKKYFRERDSDTIFCIAMVFALLFIDIALVSYYERTSLIFIVICFGLLKGETENVKKITQSAKKSR